MAYHILRRFLTFMRIPLVYGSSAPLDNILYHENVPMIIQSLCSNGYLSSIYRTIAHSITHTTPFQYSRIIIPQSMPGEYLSSHTYDYIVVYLVRTLLLVYYTAMSTLPNVPYTAILDIRMNSCIIS